MTPETIRPVLLIISDRPFVWVGFRTPDREVRRWVGERDSDEERALPSNFAGDPTDPETYAFAKKSIDLSAVVDLHDAERARGAITALRRMRPEAAVLVISADDKIDPSEIAISRTLAWTDALRGDLEGELRQLDRKRRLNELRAFASGDGDVPILMHPDPDPDALASALVVRALLNRDPDSTPIITLGDITRPENRRMAELLRMRVTAVTREELAKLPRVIAVDHQPKFEEAETRPRLAIIDHHPSDGPLSAEFTDVRPMYGATATMMTEYLRLEDERRITPALATALLYGIKTDTDSLSRGCTPEDVEAYAFLQGRADLTLLRKLARPSYSIATAHVYGEALTHIATQDDVAVVFMGKIAEDDAHVLADIADFCLALEEITWAIAGGIVDDELVLTIRYLGAGEGAGKLAKILIADGGLGGGHDSMARAVIPLEGEWAKLEHMDVEDGSDMLCEKAAAAVESMRVSRLSSPQAHQETVHT
jgi:nanoRNase/pAp phosphatase (c-di-AMP/oligoRNAs hydrolase)